MTKRRATQFSIGRLMVLTSVVALVMAISVQFKMSAIAQGLFAVYLLSLSVWAFVRGPSIVSDLADINRRRLKVVASRRELERELRERKLPRSDKNAPLSETGETN